MNVDKYPGTNVALYSVAVPPIIVDKGAEPPVAAGEAPGLLPVGCCAATKVDLENEIWMC